ncbi:MAG: hypothetical protein ABFS05_10660 [Bacteroidota bacterium]
MKQLSAVLKSKRMTSLAQFLLVILLISGVFSTSFGQNRINMIDGVYIERTKMVDDHENPDSDQKVRELIPFQIIDTCIANGDVIAFDIPGVSDFMRENNKLIKNVVLIIDDIEVSNLRAYVENAESDIIRFRFSTKKINKEVRKSLYKLPGKSLKEVTLGIKIDASNVLYFSDPANIFFKEIKTWGTIGWILAATIILLFIIFIFTWKSVIKDNKTDLLPEQEPRFSFSKSQFAFWTIIVLSSFIYIWTFTGDLGCINTTALILLGITSATITTANLINKDDKSNATKVVNGKPITVSTLRAKNPDKKTRFLEDILSDANGISIHRLQAVVFNLVFGIAFIKSVMVDYSMPEFTETQLILLGLSNGTYAFLKNKENK